MAQKSWEITDEFWSKVEPLITKPRRDPNKTYQHLKSFISYDIVGIISFICAMQVRAFQHVHGLPFVSTTCTGNLRKGTNALFSGLFHHNPEEIYKAKHYYLVILSFVFRAVIGAFAFRDVSPYAVFIIPIVFSVVLWMISVGKKQRSE